MGRKALLYAAAVCVLSWAYAYFVFTVPGMKRYFVQVMYAPALCALLFRAIERHKARQFLQPLHLHISPTSWLFAVGYPLLFIATLALLAYATGLASFNRARFDGMTHLPALYFLLIDMTLMFGEEYGWRGYLLPLLERWRGPLAATLIVGVCWALWHAPFLYLLARSNKAVNPVLLMLLQMGAVVLISFPFAFVYFRTRSIWPAMVFHYLWNHYNSRILGSVYRGKPGVMEGNVLLINGEAVAGILLGLVFAGWFVCKLPVWYRGREVPSPMEQTDP